MAILGDAAVIDRASVPPLRLEVEVLAGLLEIVLPDPQPLARWDLEVVEPADQPQVAEIHAVALVGLSDRGSGVVQLLHAELDAGPILIAQQQGLAELGPGQLYQERNLVTLSRFPLIAHARQIIRDSSGPRPAYRVATADPPDQSADPLEWERPILSAQLDLGGGQRLHVLNVHLKSKLATDIQGQKLDDYTWKTPAAWAEGFFISSMKRVGQALQVRLELDRLFTEADQAHGPAPLIAVCGDFNANSDEVPLQAICGQVEDTGNPAHGPRVMVACENQIPESARYSLFHLGRAR